MRRTLLVVDDIRTNRQILRNMLGGEYDIIEAENGLEALAVMDSDHQRISSVLLDLGMPVMDGYEVLSRMRESKKLSQLPVIVTTGQTDADSEEKALKLGAKDYISKPYKTTIIKQRIWNTINLRETAATVNALQRDRLTGLYSRDAFFEKVGVMVAEQAPGYYVMACFDVNKFKVINDQYGTEKGDEVLRYIASVFLEGFEAHGGICCRVSSDDFAVLYPSSFQDSEELAEMRRKAGEVAGLASPIAFSIGRYVITDTAMQPSLMYDRAMIAADSIRGRYDAQVAQYDESMRDHLLHEQEIVTEMESALKTGQFEIWYQPQYNHATEALIGAEALVRWKHPKKGLLPPGSFIPVFEQNGFIYELDKYVWEGVCRYLRRELDEGRSPLPVSVNISRYDVFCPGFLEFISGLTERYALPVELLRLEVTESAFAESTEHIVAMVKRLIALGFTLEIDDFGSGYSSLNTLKNVPAQVVKLDMHFLEDDGDSQRGGNIIESVVRMTKWLGMSVIAEGVETLAQADYLRSIGCNYIQGYLYARPMTEEDYRQLCIVAGKEEKLLALETVENLDNDSFWNPESMDTLIFNSYVGAACIYEYHKGKIELLRATEKYTQVIGSAGMTIEDALRLNWAEHLDSETGKRVVDDLEKSVATKKEVTGEYVFLDLPGCPHETYLRSTMRVIASSGDRWMVYCTNENITAQRKAEQRERSISEQLKSVLDNVACGITAITLAGQEATFMLTNNKYYELLGYTKEQYDAEINRKPFVTLLPEDSEMVADVVSRIRATGEAETIEYRALRREGSVIWLRSTISTATFKDIGGVLLSTYTDITEQRQAELELRDTMSQLQEMMDDIPGGFRRILVTPDGSLKLVFFNEGFRRLVGMSRQEVEALYCEGALAGVHPDDVPTVKNAIATMLKNGEALSSLYRLKHGDGYIWLRIFGRMTRNSAGETYLNIYYTDASEQVRVEQQQKELLDNLPYGAALYEYDGSSLKVVHLNKRYWELVDRSQVSYQEAAFLNAVYSEDRNIILRELEAAIRENRDVSCDLRVLHGKGEYRPFHVVGRVHEKDDGRYSIYAVYTPISDEAMSLQEMLPIALSTMMEYQTGFSFVKDRNLRYICASRDMARMLGLSSDAEMRGKTDDELFGSALADVFSDEDRKIIETGESVIDTVDKVPAPDGTLMYSRTSKFPLKDFKGNVVGVYGFGSDVTETRRMQSRLEMLTNNIPGGIAVYEGKLEALDKIKLTYFSDGFCRLFGYTREEYEDLSAANPLSLVASEDITELYRKVLSLVHDGVPLDYIYRAKTGTNEMKWINVRAVMGDSNGEDLTVNAVFFDVTRQQEALERLRISEEESRLAMQHTRNAVCRYDVPNRRLRIPTVLRESYSLPEILENVPYGQLGSGVISAETENAYKEFYENILNGHESCEVAFQRKSNRGWRWLEAHSSTIFADNGEPVSSVISYSDITEQLEKDSAYTRWQQSFLSKAPGSYSLFRCNVSSRTSFDTREGSLLTMDFKQGEFDFDQRTEEYAGQCVSEEDRMRFIQFLNADALLSGYYQGKRIVSLEYREALPEGGSRWLRLTVDLVEHAHSSDIEAYMLFEDIDEIKRQELATIERAETDPLTGVMNRTVFSARVSNYIATAKPNTRCAMLMLDIDGFKQVNDVFGHGAGDQTLIDVAASLHTVLRHNDMVCRLGGDEFLIFLTDIPNDIIAATKAQQICALTRKTFSVEVEISGSVGIATVPRDGTDFETLYKKADSALYHIKGSGKDNYIFYNDDMADEHLLLEHGTASAAGSAVLKKKRRILIVDDSRIDHALLTSIFAGDFIVEKAKDGASALIRLRHYGSAISVVLLDLMMPGMDGFAVLKKMQESPELRNVPVIVVSGDDSPETGLRAIQEGAVDFVNKPVQPDILRIRVQSAISKADNERLRAKNSFLEYQHSEVERYKTVLDRSGIVGVEHDWVAGTFTYEPNISEHIAGVYDDRGLWHILLSDMVAETQTVKLMQEAVHRVAADRKKTGDSLVVKLRTPSKEKHWFRVGVDKAVNEFGLAGRIYITFIDLGAKLPGESDA